MFKDSEEDPFVYPDCASAEAGTTHLTARFKSEEIALIGLGGTGAYILDQVSKTPVKEIRLIDGDKFKPHNAFRSPGAASESEFASQTSESKDKPKELKKVDYYAAIYRKMKKISSRIRLNCPIRISICLMEPHSLSCLLILAQKNLQSFQNSSLGKFPSSMLAWGSIWVAMESVEPFVPI